MDRQLENVDTFYSRKYGEFSRRLRLLYDRYGMASSLSEGLDKEEIEDLIATLLELRSQFRNLSWFGDVNRKGFVKITKKLNKKVPSSTAQGRYLATKVEPKQFASNNKLTLDMRAINEWLSELGDAKTRVADESDSVASGSSGSLRRMASKAALKIPSSSLEAMEQSVRADDGGRLDEMLASLPRTVNAAGYNSLKLDLLQRAISYKAFDCIRRVLKQVPSIDQEEDMNGRNCLHRLIISMGRARAQQLAIEKDEDALNPSIIHPAQAPTRTPAVLKPGQRDQEAGDSRSEPGEKMLDYILRHLSPEQRPAALSKDQHGRLPLHYAAEYGLMAVTVKLLETVHTWRLYDESDPFDAALWQDTEGFAPFHLAVMHGHYGTVRALLFADHEAEQSMRTLLTGKHAEKSGNALARATKFNYFEIVKLLVSVGIDVNYQDEQGESALHVAARYGYVECVEAMLDSTQAVNLELTEKTYGWTPMFIAAVDGHLDVVKLLRQRGAQLSKSDFSGWTPQEHAALRGHLNIAEYLRDGMPSTLFPRSPEIKPVDAAGGLKAPSLEGRRSTGVNASNGTTSTPRAPEPVKTFGHRYLQNDAMVLVSLGTLDEKKATETPPVKLDSIEITDAHATQLDTALSLVVSAQGAQGEPVVIDLPIHESINTAPCQFFAKDPSKIKLYFDLVPTYAGNTEKVIGRGVALLSSIKPTIGSKRMNLQGDLSVPLIAGGTLNVIGSVNFNFLIITPFKHPNMSISEDRTYWKKSSTMVIGHRGLGKNMNPQTSKTSLQLGENTIQSFITAASLGASYVEFDVQMTKDHVPVIYHDFLVSETGADIPVHTLTLEQFLALGKSRRKRETSPPRVDGAIANGRRAQRSFSVGSKEDLWLHADAGERMRYTRDWKAKGFKGNSRGLAIQSPFTTLEEMFKKLPEDVGFNIEMKYPMLFESEKEGLDTYAVELNSFVDIVLQKVYDLGGPNRNIIFSSFHPDICLLLSFKQPSIPVLFLSDAGTSEVGDIRASSLQEAIRFATRWNLLGIVAASEPFILCPRLIHVVKNSGLVCFSYGVLNNDAENSNVQAQAGIDAVIVDSVARVRKGLIGPAWPPDGGGDVATGKSRVEKVGADGNGLGVPVLMESSGVELAS